MSNSQHNHCVFVLFVVFTSMSKSQHNHCVFVLFLVFTSMSNSQHNDCVFVLFYFWFLHLMSNSPHNCCVCFTFGFCIPCPTHHINVVLCFVLLLDFAAHKCTYFSRRLFKINNCRGVTNLYNPLITR
jgi:hypothetical protein